MKKLKLFKIFLILGSIINQKKDFYQEIRKSPRIAMKELEKIPTSSDLFKAFALP